MDPQKKKADSDPDAVLVNAINSGKTDLFPKLVRRYEQRLYHFGFRMCNNTQDAEDLVQETFLNIFRSLKSFRFESRFKNWVYKVASRVCLKKRRKSKFVSQQELSFDELAENFQLQASDEIPNWAKQPIDMVLTSELKNIIQNTIASLPPKYRIVLVLRDMEGLNTDEAAQVMGISKVNVKVRLHRARLYLREKLQGYMAHAS